MNNTNFITDSDFGIVPDKSGVYAWFYPMRIYEVDTYDSFFYRINYFLNYSLMTQSNEVFIDQKVNESWKEYKLLFTMLGKTNEGLKKKWDTLKYDKEFVRGVLELSFWNSPLYIGKGDNLNTRINQHCNGQTDFSKRFAKVCSDFEYKKDPDFRFSSSLILSDLLLSYSTITKIKNENIEKLVQLSAKPNFSLK
jgi:hypothetical protein